MLSHAQPPALVVTTLPAGIDVQVETGLAQSVSVGTGGIPADTCETAQPVGTSVRTFTTSTDGASVWVVIDGTAVLTVAARDAGALVAAGDDGPLPHDAPTNPTATAIARNS